MPDSAVTPEFRPGAWRERAVMRSLGAAHSRAEQRVQQFLTASFELIDDKGTADFTLQELVDRTDQSLRGFYQCFASKDELLLALLEEAILEEVDDLWNSAERESEPLARLRAFTIRLHEWSEPVHRPGTPGSHNHRPIAEFAVQLAIAHPERVAAAMDPISRLLVQLIEDAIAAGTVKVANALHAAALVKQVVLYHWFSDRFLSGTRVTAEETWEFCLRGIAGDPR